MATLRMVAAAPAELGYLRLRRNKRSATASSTSTTPSSADRLSVCDAEVVALRIAHPGVGVEDLDDRCAEGHEPGRLLDSIERRDESGRESGRARVCKSG